MRTTPDAPRLPLIGEYVRGLGRLLRVEAAPPPVTPSPDSVYVWEEITARWEVRFNADRLNRGAQIWDWQGEGSAVAGAIREAQRYAKDNRIGPGHALEVVVLRITHTVRRTVGPDPTRGEWHDHTVREFGRPDQSIEPREEVVWSSRGPESQCPSPND